MKIDLEDILMYTLVIIGIILGILGIICCIVFLANGNIVQKGD